MKIKNDEAGRLSVTDKVWELSVQSKCTGKCKSACDLLKRKRSRFKVEEKRHMTI